MTQCPGCGEDEVLRGVALDDGRREITCERCGHSWTRGTAARVVAPPPPSRRSARRDLGAMRTAMG